jgi:hypothetical protein
MLNFHTYAIYRLIPVEESGPGDSHKISFQDTNKILTGYEDMAAPEYAAMVDGVFGKTFRIWSDDVDADVRIGDRLIRDNDENDMREVKGVQTHTDLPGRKIELVVIKTIPQ